MLNKINKFYYVRRIANAACLMPVHTVVSMCDGIAWPHWPDEKSTLDKSIEQMI